MPTYCSTPTAITSTAITLTATLRPTLPLCRYTFTRKGYEGLRKDVEKCLRNAHLLKVGLS